MQRHFHDILQNGEVRPQRKVLKHHSDAGADLSQAPIRHRDMPTLVHPNPAAAQKDGAAIRLFEPVDAAQQR